jgi:vacuolar-type H+-ATPase subunit I/STV1
LNDSRRRGFRRPIAALVTALVAPAGLACATTSQFDSDMQAGQYEAAAAEFARDSSLHQDPEIVLQVAELYGTPTSPLYDRDRAIAMLEEWLERYPENPDRYRAELELSLLAETKRLETLLARQDSLALRLADDLAAAGVTRDTLEGRVISVSRDNTALMDSLQQREARIDELTAELRQVRQELEALKEIDVSGS